MKYISIDPGPHTGLVRWNSDNDRYVFETLDFTSDVGGAHSLIWNYLEDYLQDGDKIICERFEYQPDKEGRAGRNYDAAEYVGVVKLFWQKQIKEVQLILQSPSQAVGKNIFWTDDKLRMIGLHRPIKHERDALRHLLYYRTFTLGDKSLLHKLR